jgi:hypothetical protein
MAAADDIRDSVAEVAQGPRRVKTGQREIEEHSLTEALDAADRIESKAAQATAATKPHFGLRFTKLVPPGGG